MLMERVPEFTEEDLESESAEIIEQIEEVVSELEEAGEIQVQEFVEIDESVDYGVGVNVCLNLLEITDEDITGFVAAYKDGTLELDTTNYSFDFDDEVFED